MRKFIVRSTLTNLDEKVDKGDIPDIRRLELQHRIKLIGTSPKVWANIVTGFGVGGGQQVSRLPIALTHHQLMG